MLAKFSNRASDICIQGRFHSLLLSTTAPAEYGKGGKQQYPEQSHLVNASGVKDAADHELAVAGGRRLMACSGPDGLAEGPAAFVRLSQLRCATVSSHLSLSGEPVVSDDSTERYDRSNGSDPVRPLVTATEPRLHAVGPANHVARRREKPVARQDRLLLQRQPCGRSTRENRFLRRQPCAISACRSSSHPIGSGSTAGSSTSTSPASGPSMPRRPWLIESPSGSGCWARCTRGSRTVLYLFCRRSAALLK